MPAQKTARMLLIALPLAAACGAPASDHQGGATAASAPSGQAAPALPPGSADAAERLEGSPRHGEWITVPAGARDSVRAWIVYPERRDPAPVVLVVHEIFGLSDWIRAVTDQLAADGFIAIAPDLLTGEGVPQGAEGPIPDSARAAISRLDPADVQRRLDAVAVYGMALPAALPRYGIVGYCWGGSAAFAHATHAPELDAAVVYYGSSPPLERLPNVSAPVLGLYGEDDSRVNATVPAADSAMRSLGKTFETEFYTGAGHGFLRAQDGRDGANLAAAQAAWPRTVGWLRRHLER